MEKEMEREAEKTIGKIKEIYNLRSRVVSIGCSPVSKAQKEETAKDKNIEDDVSKTQKEETAKGKKTEDEVSKQSKAQKVETAIGKKPEDEVTVIPSRHFGRRGPPPMTGRLLKNHLLEKQREARELATVSLYWYNRGNRKHGLPTYVLVETLGLEGCVLKRGLVRHLNFKARPKNDPGAPSELFFGERVISWHGLTETRCYRMGTESPEPAAVGREACNLCRKVIHLRGEKFYGSVVG